METINKSNINDYDDLIENLPKVRLNLIKEIFESLGINLGKTNNKINYQNYMVNDVDEIALFGSDYTNGDINSEFMGAGAGKLDIPSEFYSDKVLYEFITHAEGNIGVQWVGTYKGHDIVRSAACFGYDFPGGVHDPSYKLKLGLTISDTVSLGITNRGRTPIGGESYGGKVKWGWYTNPLPAGHSYWQKLIPYYRDAMIWAWKQPIIQNVKDPAERLARMHSINWWGYHYLKGFNGGSGWNHRLQAAKRACSGMTRFA